MRIKVFLGKDGERSLEIQKNQTIESALKKLKINPQTVIVMKNGEVVTEQETLKKGDELKILRVK